MSNSTYASRMGAPVAESSALGDEGISLAQLDEELSAARALSQDTLERGDMTYVPGAEVAAASRAGMIAFFESNALYRDRFPAVGRFEAELVKASADLFHASEPLGSITSGGTESILLAVKAARDRARAERPEVTRPEMVVPYSAHPAFWKAAELFGLTVVETPLRDDTLPDLDAYEAAITDQTVFMMGSLPSYPTGRVEPLEEMASLAADRGIHFHADGCMGGFFLPFVEALGAREPVPDFRTRGISTISADLHKFGYAYTKGVSVVLHAGRASFEHQIWSFKPKFRGDAESWYITAGLGGSRSGAPVAAAWSVMRHLGREGFLRRTRETLELMRQICDGIDNIPGLRMVRAPDVPLIAYTSDDYDIFGVADGMSGRGWVVHPDEWPERCMRTLLPWGMRRHADRFLSDLRDVAADVASGRLTSTAGVSY